MVKTVITGKGVIQLPGNGFEASPSVAATQTRTASATLTANDAGVTVLTSSAGVLTMVMPTVAAAAGAMFVFRSTSPAAHIITCSQDTGNKFVRAYGQATANATGSHGDSITLPATAGTSVAMIGDGANWLIIGGSGSITLAKGATG